MNFSIQCPSCHTKLKAKDKHIGKELACPKCKNRFVVTPPEPEVEVEEVPVEDAGSLFGTTDPLAATGANAAGNLDHGSPDLGNLDLGNLGDLDPLAQPWPSANMAQPGIPIPHLGMQSLMAVRPTQPQKDDEGSGKKPALSRPMIVALVGASVTSLAVVVCLIVLGVWLLRPSRKPDGDQVAQGGASNASNSNINSSEPTRGTGSMTTDANSPPSMASAESSEFVRGYFRFERDKSGNRFGFVASSVHEKQKTPDQKRIQLSTKRGLRIQDYPTWAKATHKSTTVTKEHWEVTAPTEKDRKLAQNNVDHSEFRLTKLSPFGTPQEWLEEIAWDNSISNQHRKVSGLGRYDHKHLWSADGKFLYVVSGANERRLDKNTTIRNHLIKVNTETWETKKEAECWDQIYDIAWSSQGLVAVVHSDVKWDSYLDADGYMWWRSGDSSLVLLDPETLNVKRAWEVPSSFEIGGGRSSDLVYLRSSLDYMMVFDVKSGEMINVVGSSEAKSSGSDFFHPVVSEDGNWLFTNNGETGALNRFRISGETFALDQTRAVGAKQTRLTGDGSHVCFASGDTGTAVSATDLNQTLGTVKGPADSMIAIDPSKKTVFLCGLDMGEKCLKLRVMQSSSDFEIVLDEFVPPSGSQADMKRIERAEKRHRKVEQELVPYDMSVDPTGRGVIVFVEQAAYWVEHKKTSDKWVFGGSTPTRFANTAMIVDKSAIEDEFRQKPPVVTTRPLPAKIVKGDTSTVIELDSFMSFSSLDVDTGNVLAQVGNDLYSLLPAFFEGDTSATIGPCQFEGPITACWKTWGKQKLILVGHKRMIWALNPQTLEPATGIPNLKNPFDTGFQAGNELTMVTTSSFPDDPFVAGTIQLQDKSGRAFRLNLLTGEKLFSFGQLISPVRPVRHEYDNAELDFFSVHTFSAADAFLRDLQFPSRRLSSDPVAVPDPFGELDIYMMAIKKGGESLKLSLNKERKRVEMLCAMEKHPWIVARDHTMLIWLHRDTVTEQKSLELPRGLQTPNMSYSNFPNTWCMDDHARGRLIIGGTPFRDNDISAKSMIWCLPLTKVKLPDEPLLAARFPLPWLIEPEKEISVPIQISDKRVKATLASAPDGAKIVNGVFTWKPGREQLGPQKFTLQLKAGNESQDLQYVCAVGNYSVGLPFNVFDAAFSSDGTVGVAWSIATEPAFNDLSMEKPQFATIDLKKKKMIASRPLRRPISKIIVEGNLVALLEADGLTVELCKVEDLTPVKTVTLTQRAIDMEIVGSRLLCLFCNPEGSTPFMGPSSQSQQLRAIQFPELAETPLTKTLSRGTGAGNIRRVSDGWLVGAAMLDEQLTTVKSFCSIEWANVYHLCPPTGEVGSQAVAASIRRPPRIPGDNAPVPADAPIKLVTKPMTSPEAANKKGTLLSVSFNSSANDSQPTEYPITTVWGEMPGNGYLITSQDRVGIVGDYQLFTLVPSELGNKTSKQSAPQSLTLRPASTEMEISPNKKTTVRFKAENGKAPYQFTCTTGEALRQAGFGDPKTLIEEGNQPGSFVIDGQAIVKMALTNDTIRQFIQGEISKESRPAEKIVDTYISHVNAALQSFYGKKIGGFPVAIPLNISVIDVNKQRVALCHPMVVEIPREKVLEIAKKFAQPPGGNPRSGNAQVDAANQHPLPGRMEITRSENVPFIWNDVSVTDFANQFRQVHPTLREISPPWTVERLAAYYSIQDNHSAIERAMDREFNYPHEKSKDEQPQRTWRTTDGKELSGRLKGFTDNSLSIQREQNTEIDGEINGESVPIGTLDELSMRRAWTDVLQLRKPVKLNARSESGSRSELGYAVDRFSAQFGYLPPRALVDGQGKPLLSWRVMLLPYLGHSRLFRLFHLDEPWDSEHNKKLLPFMPVVYSPSAQAGMPVGRATLLAVVGPKAAFLPNGMRRTHDIEDLFADTLLLVEVDAKSAVEWTKPEDFEVTDTPTAFDQLVQTKSSDQQTESADIYTVGLFADGQFVAVPRDKNPRKFKEAMLHATQIDDGKLSGLSIKDPNRL